jgi:hypothetical protein
VRPRRELFAPFVHVDFLAAEGKGEALLGRRLEGDKLHAEHLGIEADAALLVARGEDDVVDVVDHGLRSITTNQGRTTFSPVPRENVVRP